MARKRGPKGDGSVFQRGDDRWVAQITIGRNPTTGKQMKKSFYGKTQGEVIKKKQKYIADMNAGVLTEPSRMLFGEWLSIWLDEYTADLKPLTIVNYTSNIRNHIMPTLGPVRLQALTVPAIQAFYNGLSRQGYAPSTVNGIHAIVSGSLKKAVEIGYIRSNPASLCTIPRIQKPAIHPLDDAGMLAFMEAIKGNRYERLFLLDLFTGMRRSEIVGLTWDAIDFERGTIHVHRQLQRIKGAYVFSPLKNNRVRVITPPATAMQLLQEQRSAQNIWQIKAGPAWENKEGFVFVHEDGTHMNAMSAFNNFKRIIRQIGYNDTRLHDLRHSFAILSVRSGIDYKSISASLGHAKVGFTMDTYVHVTQDMQKENAARIEGFISALKTPVKNL